jgi:hypothetical protein
MGGWRETANVAGGAGARGYVRLTWQTPGFLFFPFFNT